MSNSDTSSRLQAPAVIMLLLACLSTVIPVTLMNRFADLKDKDQLEDLKGVSPSDIPTHAGLRSVHAGLWSDPFEGLGTSQASPKTDDAPKTDEAVGKNDKYSELLHRFAKLHVVAVIVPGENTATDIEDRTNYRHAVEQALANEGYSMEFPGRMSFAQVTWTLEKNETHLSHRSDVPLKLYRRESNSEPKQKPDAKPEPPEGLLVCWIDRRFLGDKPLESLDKVLRQIDGRSTRKTTVVGPMYSSELTTMAEEAVAFEAGQVTLTNWAEWSIVSPAATNKEAQDLAEEYLTSCGFHSTIGTDDRIAEKLVQEIAARRLHLGKVVIFCEAGATSPGGLKASLETLLKGAPLKGAIKSPIASSPCKSEQIRSFEYLRGIGSVKRDGSTRVDDYFLRKLDSVVTDEQELSPSSVSAVIVLGDEVHDKVKLTEIAKASFPNATCLTHDLSYLYSTPGNIAFCRGLLVASHGGLSVKNVPAQVELEDQQPQENVKETIEFRDVYQRSFYQAMTYALNVSKSENKEDSETTIFEIGLQHPIKIEPGSTKVRWWNLIMFTTSGTAALLICLFSMDYLQADRLRNLKERLNALLRADETGLVAFTLVETNMSLMVVGVVVYQQLRMHTSTFANVMQVLAALTALCVVVRIGYALLRNNTQVFGSRFAVNSPTRLRMIDYLLTIWLVAFISIFVILEIFDKEGLQLEPLDAFSGISVWPSIAAFAVVIALSLYWLRKFGQGQLAWQMKGDDLSSLFPSLSHQTESETGHTAPHHISKHLSIQELSRVIAERTNHFSEKTPALAFSVDSLARFVVFSLLLCVFGWQFDDAYRHGLWSLIPLPPARGALAISLGLFLGTLSLLLCLKMSVTAWYQFFVFRRFARCIRETWKLVHDGKIEQKLDQANAVKDLYWACDFLQAGSYWLVRNALWHPSLVLLLFAISRMPMFETWQVNSETVLLVAGIPVVLGLISSFLVRAECRRMRDMSGRILLDWTVDPTIVYAANSPAAISYAAWNRDEAINDELVKIKEFSKDTKGKIESMNQGAFVSLWNDPVVGSILAIATAMASGPGKGVLDFLLKMFA
ncbi:MAG: hypothetical protein SFV81_02985 [Pirellulaceae bacterium]|nr:hypothetical protein [Pirellulaceae bacterium]